MQNCSRKELITIKISRVYAAITLAAASVMLITLTSACFMPSAQVWEIFKILYWKNGIGWIIILMSISPISISGLRAMFSSNDNCHDILDDTPTLYMIVSAAICCIIITFMSPMVTASKLTMPVYGNTTVTDRVSSKYLTKSKQVISNHYQQIDGDTFIVNGQKYKVADSHQVKMNISDGAKTLITITDYDFKKSTPKWVIEYTDHTGSLPSKNQSDYRRVLITGHAIKQERNYSL